MFLALVLAAQALAGDPKLFDVSICVSAADGAPVASAVLHHAQVGDRQRVNADTGCWEDSALYLPDGTEVAFVRDTELDLEVTAPGFIGQTVRYKVRGGRNVVKVVLEPLELVMDDDPDDIDTMFYRTHRREDDVP